jgi:outer membrane protein assembly factor BamA
VAPGLHRTGAVRRTVAALACGLGFTCATAARAQDTPAVPEFVSARGPLDPYQLARKHEGTYPTGLPLVDTDPDMGYGFGAQGFVYWDGERTDPLFAYAPYRHRLSVQVFWTTNGYQQHKIDYDAPYLFGSAFRLRAQVYYEKNTAENYFGRGSSTLNDLGFTAAGGRTYSDFGDYTSALRQIRPGNVAYTLYNKYSLEDPTLATTVERSLAGGLVRLQLGFGGQYVSVKDYTGTPTQGDDLATGATGVAATMGNTRLHEDCKAARVVGCSGGMHDTIKLGVAFDTRDYEPDPNFGIFADLTEELSSRAIGSDYDYARVTFSPRAFYSPMPKLADLVIAGRAVYSVQTDGVPFFAMNTLAFTDGDKQGLGGLWTLRGYKQDRFVGLVSAMANVEVRWTFVNFPRLWGQDFALQLAPFLDMGRVFDRVADFTFAGWKRGQGAGLHVLWNKATIIMVEYGVSSEDQGLYMDFGQQF